MHKLLVVGVIAVAVTLELAVDHFVVEVAGAHVTLATLVCLA